MTKPVEDLSAPDLATLQTAIGFDTDTTLAANSDSKVATQKAVKAYIASMVTGLADLKGDTDCSANPNYPAASKGDLYYVTVAGKIGGASGKSVDVGDAFIAKADNAGGTEASVGTSWFVLEHNLSGVALLSGATFTGDIVVPDEAYDATAWNGSLEAPTKNAVRDKIEALAGSAALFDPPAASDFGTAYGGGLTLTDNTQLGLLVDCGALSANVVRCKSKAVPAGDWWVKAKIKGFCPTQQFSGFGLGVVDNAATKTFNYTLDCRNDFRSETWTGNTYVGVPIADIGPIPTLAISGMIEVMLRISYASSTNTYTCDYSIDDGATWTTSGTYVNAHFATPGYVGFNAVYARTTGPLNYFICTYWDQSW